MNEEEKRYAATLLNCRHSKEEVVDRFDKNAVITATSMNSLKNQIFQMLGIDDSKFRTTSWMKMMRMNGKTSDKLCKQGPAPAPAPVPVQASASVPIAKPKPKGTVYLLKGPDFGYIGQTLDGFENRMRNHERACLDNCNRNFKTNNSTLKIYTAITNNGGWANIKTSIIEDDIKSKKETLDREKYWIQYYKDNIPIYLLNSLNMRPRTK
jgi:hypothetical protein